jgi:hypothetical protein
MQMPQFIPQGAIRIGGVLVYEFMIGRTLLRILYDPVYSTISDYQNQHSILPFAISHA